MRIAIIDKNGLVVNLAEVAPGWNDPKSGKNYWKPPEGMEVIELENNSPIGKDFIRKGKDFQAPISDQPVSVPLKEEPNKLDVLMDLLVSKGLLKDGELETAVVAASAETPNGR